MYKKFSYLPKKFNLVLKFKTREQNIIFFEPTMYDLMIFEELIEEWEYLEALNHLNIKIKKTDFLSNPIWILKKIMELCYWSNKKDNDKENEPWFFPSSIDLLAERFWKTLLEILKEVTPSILNTYFAWFEFNINLQNNKKWENFKFKEKQKISENDMKNYEDIIKRVNKFSEKKKNF